MPYDAGTAVGTMVMDPSQWNAGLQQAQGQINNFESAWSTTAKNIETGAQKIQSVGKSLTKNLTLPILGVGTAAIKFGSSFDSAMAQVAATMGVPTSSIENLREAAIKTGEQTKFSAKEAAEGLNYLALAGYDADQQMAALPKITRLAAAGNYALADASDDLTDVIAAFGMTSKDSTVLMQNMDDVLNTVAFSSTKTNQSVSQFMDGLLKVGATAKTLSGGVFEAQQVLGLMADNSIKATEGGTHLRNIILAMIPKSDAAAAAFDRLGVSGYDAATGELRPLEDTFLDLQKALAGYSEQEQNAMKAAIFNKTDLAAVNALLGTSKERWDEVGDAIYGAKEKGTAAADMEREQLNNLLGDITMLISALGTSAIRITDSVSGTLRNLVQSLTKMVVWFNNLDKSTISLIVKFAAFAASIGPITTAFGKMASIGGKVYSAYNGVLKPLQMIAKSEGGIRGLFNVFKSLGSTGQYVSETMTVTANGMTKTWLGVANGIGNVLKSLFKFSPIILAIIAVVALFKDAWDKDFGFIRENTQSIINSLQTAWTNFVSFITGIIDGFVNAYNNNFLGMKETMETVIGEITNIWNALMTIVSSIVAAIAQLLQGDMAGALENFKVVGSSIGDVFTSLVNILKTLFSELLNILVSVISSIITYVSENFPQIMETIGETLQSIWDKIKEVAPQLWDAFVGAIQNMWEKVKEASGAIVDYIKENWPQIKEKAAEIWQNVKDTVVEKVQQLREKLPEIWENIKEKAKAAWEWLKEKIPEWFNSAKEKVVEKANELKAKLPEIWENVKQKASECWEGIKQKVQQAWPGIVNAVVSFVKQLPTKIWQWLVKATLKFTDWVGEVTPKAAELGVKFLGKLGSWLVQLPAKIWSWLMKTLPKVAAWVADMVGYAIKMGPKFLKAIWSFMMQMPGKIGHYLGLALGTLIKWGVYFVAAIVKAGADFIAGLVEFIANIPEKMADLIYNLTHPTEGLDGDFFDIAVNTIKGFISGIGSMAKDILKAAGDFVSGFLGGVKDALGIHSPSRVARDEIGKNFALGVIQGITGQKKNAKKSAEDLSKSIVSQAKKDIKSLAEVNNLSKLQQAQYWKTIVDNTKKGSSANLEAQKLYLQALGDTQEEYLSKMEKKLSNKKVFQDVSAKFEAEYWKNVLNNFIKGSDEYISAYQKYTEAEGRIQEEYVQKYENKLNVKKIYQDVSADSEAAYWKKVLSGLKKGTDEYNDVYQKYTEAEGRIQEEYVQKYEKKLSDKKIFQDVSAKQEAAYWQKVLKGLKKGTDEYNDVYSKWKEAQENAEQERLDGLNKWLDRYKTYNDLTVYEEMKFWEQSRLLFEDGTDQRLEADKNYLEAKESFVEECKELDEQYVEDQKKIYDDLKSQVEELNKEYEDALSSRQDAILGSFKLFDAYEAKEATTGETIMENLRSQVDALINWDEQLSQLERRSLLPKELVDEIRDMGVDASQEIMALNSMTDEQLMEYVQLWQQKSELARQRALQELEPTRQDIQSQIQQLVQDAALELDKITVSYKQDLADMQTLSETMGKKIAQTFASSISNGIKLSKAQSAITYAGYTVMQNLLGAVDDAAKDSNNDNNIDFAVTTDEESFNNIYDLVSGYFTAANEEVTEQTENATNTVTTGLQTIQTSVDETLESIYTSIGSYLSQFVAVILTSIALLKQQASMAAYSAGQAIVKQLFEGMNKMAPQVNSLLDSFNRKVSNLSDSTSRLADAIWAVYYAKEALSSMGSYFGVNGYHKSGLDYVPFDGYVASLHKGERVLTKEENESYNKSDGTSIVNNFYGTQPLDEKETARQFKRAQKEIAMGFY